MCGIVAWTGSGTIQRILLDGLSRLEYRGYDSAGLCLQDRGKLTVRKEPGRILDLRRLLDQRPLTGHCGIGHTRWATHGPATRENAHPHLSPLNDFAVVHNGIIENHLLLRKELEEEGVLFRSQTDTEVIVHLVRRVWEGDLAVALRKVSARLEGSYAVALMDAYEPGVIVGMRQGSPLSLAVGPRGHGLASDPMALAEECTGFVHLADGEMVILTATEWTLLGADGVARRPALEEFRPGVTHVDRGGWPTFMEKEIREQPEALERCLEGRLDVESGLVSLPELERLESILPKVKRVVLVGCGTSWHAGLLGEYYLERLAQIPAETEYASEYRYRGAPADEGTLFVAISQSGETADTLAALHEVRRLGAHSLVVTNAAGSTLDRTCDASLLLRCGPEVGVASTKAFTTQVLVLLLLALKMAQVRGIAGEEHRRVAKALAKLPDLMREALGREPQVKALAASLASGASGFLFLGRDLQFPIALEGALKLKEISYINAQGYPAAEMKHGPIALVDRAMVVVVMAPQGRLFDKTRSNIQEVLARRGRVVVISDAAPNSFVGLEVTLHSVPATEEALMPFLTVVPLQLLALRTAEAKGCDVDKPRNLAKSVTVE